MIDKENKAKKEDELGEEEVLDAGLEDVHQEDSESSKKKKKGSKHTEKADHLEEEIAELKDKYLRLFAEFDNYKKRTIKEKLDLMRSAAQDTLTSLLPVLDDFDRARKNEGLSEGLELLYNKLSTLLRNMGLNEMESTGKDFNVELHEAITEIPAPSEELKGKVVDTVEKGYYLHDKIIRHAKVVVGR